MSEKIDSALILKTVCDALLNGQVNDAEAVLKTEYPFSPVPMQSRKYSEMEKTKLFLSDGFLDRYTGKKLIYTGTLRLLSHLMPDVFPFHTNWRMDSCHIAYWELTTTLDHLIPIARGGLDQKENWLTTSMLNNARKANWTLDEMGWKLLPQGNLAEWDGLISIFVQLVEISPDLLAQRFVQKYYRIAKIALKSLSDDLS
jgi:5-methylcytosine-specific restriction endonuclease McrA